MTTAGAQPAQAAPRVLDHGATCRLLDFPALVAALHDAVLALDAGRIACPERLVLPMAGGTLLLSMPAVAHDLAVHKLITVAPGNAARGLPAIQGVVTVLDAATGSVLCTLDGPAVTGRRTAAMSMLGLRALLPRAPRHLLLVGTGAQAQHHAEAIAALHAGARLSVRGSSLAAARRFCDANRGLPLQLLAVDRDSERDTEPGIDRGIEGRRPHRHSDDIDSHIDSDIDIDAVITCTNSRVPVYDAPARPGRLLVAVGAFQPTAAEIGPGTVRASTVFVDDPAGARHEAGDLLLAGVDWRRVRPLAQALRDGVAPLHAADMPLLFKTVGCAAWDLAAARVALDRVSAAV